MVDATFVCVCKQLCVELTDPRDDHSQSVGSENCSPMVVESAIVTSMVEFETAAIKVMAL